MGLNKESMSLAERATRHIPGQHSNLPGYEKFQPVFMVKGKGARVWDADGNEYIDYMCGLGAGILGYGNEEYLEKVKAQLDGLYYLDAARRTPLEVELAEKIVKHVPCAESVRFLLSGTEAVQLVLRLARAYTKRRIFIRFEGHYHGWLDNVLGGIVNENPTGRPFGIADESDIFKTEGRDPAALEQSFRLPWNDIETLENTLKKYGEEVALIHMEPILANGGCCPPRPGFLERVRELCDQYGIVLSFDEIITGFRVGLNGAQGLLGVTPDLTTLGKGVAGGIPLSMVVGKRKIMDLLRARRVVGAGTFNAYPLGLAAGLASIGILERDDGAFYKKLGHIQQTLCTGLKEIAGRHGVATILQGPLGVFFFNFLDRDVAYTVRDWKGADHEKQDRFRQELLDAGVMILFRGRWYVSGGHTMADITRTLETVDKVMKRLA